ncbi:MAG: epoxyqueuosine reductase [Lachnospiraceae bacterium]|nr:epoxyqueuosine reductase [Lachnospiraceae bacterium]
MHPVVEEKIRQIFLKYPNILYGFTSISYSQYASQYRSALVLAVPYGEQLTIKNYTEERFEKGIQDAKKALEEIVAQVEEILNEQKVKYYIPPAAQSDEEELIAPFSFKYAAVNAGLGWIGKNDVVITEKYGPRVRLSAVLIDNPFVYGQRITKSNCPDSCRKCVEICSYNALHDVKWDIDALRDDLIDYKLCNQKRSLYIEKHGRKNACGLCMVACPIGI